MLSNDLTCPIVVETETFRFEFTFALHRRVCVRAEVIPWKGRNYVAQLFYAWQTDGTFQPLKRTDQRGAVVHQWVEEHRHLGRRPPATPTVRRQIIAVVQQALTAYVRDRPDLLAAADVITWGYQFVQAERKVVEARKTLQAAEIERQALLDHRPASPERNALLVPRDAS